MSRSTIPPTCKRHARYKGRFVWPTLRLVMILLVTSIAAIPAAARPHPSGSPERDTRLPHGMQPVTPSAHGTSGASYFDPGTLSDTSPLEVEFMGYAGGGTSRTITVHGGYAYVAGGPILMIVDIADPARPTRVGAFMVPDPNTFAIAGELFVAGNYGYLPTKAALLIIDLSTPAAPTLVGSYPGTPHRVFVIGNRAYVAIGTSMHVVDISHPAQPALIGSYTFPSLYPLLDMEVAGNYAYLIYHEGFVIVDVGMPAAPRQVSHIQYAADSLEIGNGFAYLKTIVELVIIDIANPAAPQEVVRYEPGYPVSHSSSLVLVGAQLYFPLESWAGYVVVDVSDPTVPKEVGRLHITSQIVAVIGSHIYARVLPGILVILDITDLSLPREVGRYDPWPWVWRLKAVAGNYAYVTGQFGTVGIVDVSNPAAPVEMGVYRDSEYVPLEVDRVDPFEGIAATERHAYVARSIDVLVLDVSNPRAPALVGRYIPSGEGQISDIVLRLPYLYVAMKDGLRIVDLADPLHPREVGTYTSPTPAFYDTTLTVAGTMVYLATGESLHIVNLSDPTQPTLAGSYTSPLASVHTVTVSGHYAFLLAYRSCGNHTTGLEVVDIADPAHPTLVGTYSPSCEYLPEMAVRGGYAYFTTQENVQIVDIRQPAAPKLLAQINLPTTKGQLVSGAIQTWDIIVVDNLMYLASIHGLYVARHHRWSVGGQITHANRMPAAAANVLLTIGATTMTRTDQHGTYQFSNLLRGTYTMTPTLDGYSFWPRSRALSLASDARGQDFVMLAQPISTTVTPDVAGSLTYTDTQGLPTSVIFPIGALPQTATLVLTPTVVEEPGPLAFAGHAFDLTALPQGPDLTGVTFGAPVTATIRYSAADVAVVTDTAKLVLGRWMGSAWQDVATTCAKPTAYHRDATRRTVSVTLCQPGRYALFGPTRRTYLPILWRRRPGA